MQQYSLTTVIQSIAERLKENKLEGLEQIIAPALTQFPDNPALWFYQGYYHNVLGNTALAATAWEKSFALEPQPVLLGNLGAALRDSGRSLEARRVLERALFLSPDDVAALSNLVGSYVNEGEPWEGIAHGEHLVKLDPTNGPGQFNLALLLLEAGLFDRGFDHYARGFHQWRDRREYPGAEKLTTANFERAKGKRLIVHGEQGIGDELMFFTMIPEVRRDFDLILDIHPRLERLHRMATWGDLPIHATRKATPEWCRPDTADFYTPVGNLAQFYRRTQESFTWNGPQYRVDQDERALNRTYLETLAPGKKIVGLALRGGTLKTSRSYRVVAPPVLDALWRREDLVFVSLDYDDVTKVAEWVAENYGPERFFWYPAINWTWDLDHYAALIAACDATVSVCQSAAHMAAALGCETHVLAPNRPAWRYGLESPEWFWYPHAKARIYRQTASGSWDEAVAELEKRICTSGETL